MLCALLGTGIAAEVGLYADDQCTSCRLEVGPGESDEFFVRFITDGLPDQQFMTSAGFRIVGLPPGWTAVATPHPDAPVALGSVFGSGANIAFSSARDQSCSLLYAVRLEAPAAAEVTEGFVLEVRSPDPPSIPELECPWISVACALGPCDIVYCVEGGRLFVNTPGDCTVDAESEPWSFIKALFR